LKRRNRKKLPGKTNELAKFLLQRGPPGVIPKITREKSSIGVKRTPEGQKQVIGSPPCRKLLKDIYARYGEKKKKTSFGGNKTNHS